MKTNQSHPIWKFTATLGAIACLGLAAVVPAAAQVAAPSSSLVAAASSRLWLEGDSTLHKYSSNATKVEVTAGFEPSTANPSDLRTAIAGGGLKSLVVTAPVEGLKSGDAGLDKNLWKALKEEAAPVLRFTLVDYKAEDAKDGSLVVKAHGRLAIAGVEKDAMVEGVCSFGKGGLEVTGAKELLMSDFGIKPPTMMLGAVKTADKVVVHFALKLNASDATREKQ